VGGGIQYLVRAAVCGAAWRGVDMPCIVINSETCKGCYLCIEVCPKKSIAIGKELNSKGYHPAMPVENGECSGCESCMIVCPELSIEVYDEE